MAFELVAVNSPYYDANTCHHQAMCYKKQSEDLDLTKREIFQFNLSQNNGKIRSKRCRADFSSIWDW